MAKDTDKQTWGGGVLSTRQIGETGYKTKTINSWKQSYFTLHSAYQGWSSNHCIK